MRKIIVLLALVGLSLSPLMAEKQPNMEAALNQLKAAKQSLEKATDDKGGHRAKAMKLINEAMEQVQKGIDFDNKK